MGSMVKKNDEYVVTIEDQGYNGEGICKLNGYTVFVDNAICGELAKIKILKANANFAYAKVVEILKPSQLRQDPTCDVNTKCGGCNLQHMSYEAQLNLKKKIVEDNLRKIAKINVCVEDTIGMGVPYAYRNKLQYPVGIANGKKVMGVYGNNSHNIVSNERCYIQSEITDIVAKDVFNFIKDNNISLYDEQKNKGLVRNITVKYGINTDEIMVVIVCTKDKLPKQEKFIKYITEKHKNIKTIVLNINSQKTNVILGEENKVIYGDGYITDILGEYKFNISPLSFYQVNPVQTELLYNKVLEFAKLDKTQTVFDLYCGVGTISIFISKFAKKVYGIENVSEAIKDAKENAKQNSISNVEFVCGEVENKLPIMCRAGISADVIILDPPRKGCDKVVLETIASVRPTKIVYVSCNPATLARDIFYLSQNGYSLEKVQPVDMFPQTRHCESVCVLERRRN